MVPWFQRRFVTQKEVSPECLGLGKQYRSPIKVKACFRPSTLDVRRVGWVLVWGLSVVDVATALSLAV